MKLKKGFVLIPGVLLIGAALWFFLLNPGATNEESGGQSSVDENTIAVVEVDAGTISVTVEGPSVVEPFRLQDIRSRIAGTIAEAVDEGAVVEKDGLLVRFDDTELAGAVLQAELNLQQARVDLRRAQLEQQNAAADFAEKERLFSEGAITRDQRDSARSTAANAELSVESARIRVLQSELGLETATLELENTEVRAPYSGVVLSAAAGQGDVVTANSILMSFADISRLRLKAEVDEFDIGKVHPGMPVVISADSLREETLESSVERVSPAAEIVNNISIFTVSTVLRNDGEQLRPGMSADMTILVSEDTGIIVPASAVSSVRGRFYLDVYENDEIVTRRVVAGTDNGTNIVITEGLETGEMVVVPQTAGFSLGAGSTTAAGSSIIPIQMPGAGGSR